MLMAGFDVIPLSWTVSGWGSVVLGHGSGFVFDEREVAHGQVAPGRHRIDLDDLEAAISEVARAPPPARGRAATGGLRTGAFRRERSAHGFPVCCSSGWHILAVLPGVCVTFKPEVQGAA
jgi:hypothetical protein